MKHKINKMAAIFIITMFALSGLGISYAGWTDAITIDGTAETGELKWEFTELCSVADPYSPDEFGYQPSNILYLDWNCDPNYGYGYDGDGGWGPTQSYANGDEKNVGWGEIIRVDVQTLKLTIHNAYPGYWNGVETHVINTGTIPLKFQSVLISHNADGSGPIALIGFSNSNDVHYINLDESGGIDMEFVWGNHLGLQLHNGDVPWEISFGFCFLQPLPQDQTYTFYITYEAVQWNEYDDPTD